MPNTEKMILRARSLRSNQTDAEKKLWNALRRKSLGYRFNRQYIVDNIYIVDFICFDKNLILEIDGGQHNDNPKDVERDKYLIAKGYEVIRLWNNEILSNLSGCLEMIKSKLDSC